MWYLYLRRDQHYMRSFRTHNLWLDTYAKKMRAPKVTAFHVSILKRLSKSVSGVSLHSQSQQPTAGAGASLDNCLSDTCPLNPSVYVHANPNDCVCRCVLLAPSGRSP